METKQNVWNNHTNRNRNWNISKLVKKMKQRKKHWNYSRIGRTGRKGNSGTAYTLFTRTNAAKVHWPIRFKTTHYKTSLEKLNFLFWWHCLLALPYKVNKKLFRHGTSYPSSLKPNRYIALEPWVNSNFKCLGCQSKVGWTGWAWRWGWRRRQIWGWDIFSQIVVLINSSAADT